MSEIPYDMLLMSENEVRTRFSSLSSGKDGMRSVTSIRPNKRSCVKAVKSDNSFRKVEACDMSWALVGLISSRLFPDRFRYRRAVFQFLM